MLKPMSLSFRFLSVNLVVVVFLFISVSGQSIDLSYPNCPALNCSNVIIRYSFWRIDSEPTTQFCGYQGLGISCSSLNGGVENISSITLGGADSYYVKNINYESTSIGLIDYNFFPAAVNVASCPRVRHNIELETLPLGFSTSSVNLSFHFSCTPEGILPPDTTKIWCLSCNERRSLVNIMNSETANFDWDAYSCDQEVVTTVFRDEDIPLPSSWETALTRGFELIWRTDGDCLRCEDSNGRCGGRNTTGFICFCPKGDCNGTYVHYDSCFDRNMSKIDLLVSRHQYDEPDFFHR